MARRRTGIRLMVVAGSVAAVLSCSESAAPTTLPGTYALRAVRGRPLPERWDTSSWANASVFIRSGRLEVIDPDTMKVSVELEHIDIEGNVVDSFPGDSYWVNYAVIGDSIAATEPPGWYFSGHVLGGSRLLLKLYYPVAPTSGYQFLIQDFEFVKQ